jgi:beta-mannosidase
MLHYFAQRFYAPVTVVAVPEGDRILLKGVNDLPESVEITLLAQALGMDGTLRELDRTTGVLNSASDVLLSLAADALGPDEVLIFDWITPEGQHGSDHFAPKPYKDYALPDPGLSLAQTGNQITVSATAPAFFVTVEADCPGRFTRNAFTVLPDQPVELSFLSNDPAVSASFRLIDLHSATVAQQ